MKYLAIIPFLYCTVLFGNSNSSKHTYLIERLSEAYQSNNALIHKQAKKKDFDCIEILTDNYIDQLQYIKILSDNQLNRRLNEQSIQFITESIVLKNYIVDIYDRESLLIQKTPQSSLKDKDLRAIPEPSSWPEATSLIYRTLGILNRLEEAPSLIQHVSGKVNNNVLLRYNNKAIQANQQLRESTRKVIIKHILPIKGTSDTQRTYYALGTTTKEGQSSQYLARISLINMTHGLYFEDIQEIQDIKTIKRILNKLEGIHP